MAEVYDTSDARRQLALIKQEMDEARAARQQVVRGATDVTSSGAKIWGESQKTKLAEILAMKTPTGEEALYQMNPEYMKKGMLGRFFTPAAGKVTPIDPSSTGPGPAPGPQSMKDMVGKDLGKITGGIGAAMGLYSASQYDWGDDKNLWGKVGSIAQTGLGIASLAGVPGLGWYTLGAGALGLLDYRA